MIAPVSSTGLVDLDVLRRHVRQLREAYRAASAHYDHLVAIRASDAEKEAAWEAYVSAFGRYDGVIGLLHVLDLYAEVRL